MASVVTSIATSANYYKEQTNDILVVVMFYLRDKSECMAFRSSFDNIAERYWPHVQFRKVNVF